MNYEKNRALNVFTIIISILSLTIPTVIFILTASDNIRAQSINIFGIIAIITIGFYVIYLMYKGYGNLRNDVQNNKKEITDIKKSLNYKELFDNMNVRVKVLEELIKRYNKKGQIDPRIIYIIIMLILLYLFLKSVKILP